MSNKETENNRRAFLKKCGLSTIPFLLQAASLNALPFAGGNNSVSEKTKSPVNFIYDGLVFSPKAYVEKLLEINKTNPIEPDFYGNGGATQLLEEAFAKLTGKEKAIYLPSGTMANQLAIKLLNENNTKVIVPENSHIYRDEADAAQSVHNKRLLPVGKDKPYFDLADLENTIDYITTNEVFSSGLGTVVIENPIRRAQGATVPIDIIRNISKYCKKHGYKMHLDGARLHLAAAYTNVTVAEYASNFDTVYISLYKYLNASGGAMLCGDAKLIDLISHQIKIHGGTVFQSWNATAMALHYLNGINERWSEVVKLATSLIADLNKIDGIKIMQIKNGTNIYDLVLSPEISLKTFANFLYKDYNIWIGKANELGIVKLTVNESLLSRDTNEIISACKLAVKHAKK